MGSWQSGFVQANGIRVHYNRTGGDLPKLVLAHGVTDDGLCWTPLARALESEFDIVMVDARAHGESEAPEAGYEPATLAADLAAVIREIGLDRPAILGHSMGAITALALAGTFPELPGAILAEDPPPWWMGPMPPAADGRDIVADIRASIVEMLKLNREDLIAHQRAETPWWPEEDFAPWAESKLRFNENGLGLFSKSVVTSVDWLTTLPRITCPLLLITADTERGAIVPPIAASRLKEMVPQTRVVHIPDAGHSIHRDQQAAFLDTVRTFLATIKG